jgi:hypothetical protein
VRALRDAATSTQTATSSSPPTLPTPLYCSPAFCNKKPQCVTSYEPNLGRKLGAQLIETKSPGSRLLPRLGISHYTNNPAFALNDIEERSAPLGYIDRKFGYRLSLGKEDASTALIAFTSETGGPLILCEPPCFVDECPPKRMMPLTDHVIIQVDGQVVSKRGRASVEVGRFCVNVMDTLPPGEHRLLLTTNLTSREFVMFSHVISF